MNYSILQAKRDNYQKNKHILATATADSFEAVFDIEYTHNSTAIEGNTLTLIETKTVLEDRLSVGGKELREIYEVINHDKAYRYVKSCVANGKPLDEETVKDIHAIVRME